MLSDYLTVLRLYVSAMYDGLHSVLPRPRQGVVTSTDWQHGTLHFHVEKTILPVCSSTKDLVYHNPSGGTSDDTDDSEIRCSDFQS